ncbi:MAG: hypothetical protein K8R74_03235 [Bacteroidales bacterium]|nr:hypothetical protein [Bacteroidales bacterium]
MSKIRDIIDFMGFSEQAGVALRELFPNLGKNELPMVYVYDIKYSHYYRNKKR